MSKNNLRLGTPRPFVASVFKTLLWVLRNRTSSCPMPAFTSSFQLPF
nr:MAG TPA: hypothetical protein [Caudoviricetes sp.]